MSQFSKIGTKLIIIVLIMSVTNLGALPPLNGYFQTILRVVGLLCLYGYVGMFFLFFHLVKIDSMSLPRDAV